MMSSVRRVALATQTSSFAPFIGTASCRSGCVQTLTYRRTHQRRSSSSSKSSSSSNRSKRIPDEQTTQSSTSEAPDGSKAAQTISETTTQSTRASKKKSKGATSSYTVKGRDESIHLYPSVPSTHHIKDSQIAAATFFSLHRPISVTSTWPKSVTDDSFASIFTPRTKINAKTSEVISTLSSALNRLDIDIKVPTDAQANEIEANSLGTQEELKRNQNTVLSFPDHILGEHYQPFNPPSPPKAPDALELAAAEMKALETSQPQHRTYKAVLTVEESTDENGNVTWNAHSSPLVAEDPELNEAAIVEEPKEPLSYRERMNIRQQRYEEAHKERRNMFAISVKRQRKLKMKKHKYKKLMKKTRNLRRRQERA